jgi:transcriptional regulator
MSNNNIKLKGKSYITPRISDFNEISDMFESGMEDYEIANELGMAKAEVSKLEREIYTD